MAAKQGRSATKTDAKAVVQSIVRDLKALGSESVGPLRALRRSYTKKLKDVSAKEMVAIGLGLVAYDDIPYRFLAYELIAFHASALASLTAASLRRLGKSIDGWNDVDIFGIYLTGVCWREGQVGDDEVKKWARSRDLWWRRTALVSTVPLNLKSRGGTGNTHRTLVICELLIDDREDMIEKALSWALRSLVPWDAAAVQGFIDKNESRLAARVKREVRNKLRTGVKNPRQSK